MHEGIDVELNKDYVRIKDNVDRFRSDIIILYGRSSQSEIAYIRIISSST